MIAVIFSAGFGTRLGNLTQDMPKPLIKIGEKSVLEHIVDRFKQYGINQIIVKVHYLPDKIMAVLGDKVIYYYEPALFDWKDTLQRLRPWIENDKFLVCNGDTISDLNLSEMIAFHKEGTITALFDDWRAAGTWIYPKTYFTEKDIPVIPYRPNGLNWYDIGTPSRLEAAREHFEKGKIII